MNENIHLSFCRLMSSFVFCLYFVCFCVSFYYSVGSLAWLVWLVSQFCMLVWNICSLTLLMRVAVPQLCILKKEKAFDHQFLQNIEKKMGKNSIFGMLWVCTTFLVATVYVVLFKIWPYSQPLIYLYLNYMFSYVTFFQMYIFLTPVVY